MPQAEMNLECKVINLFDDGVETSGCEREGGNFVFNDKNL